MDQFEHWLKRNSLKPATIKKHKKLLKLLKNGCGKITFENVERFVVAKRETCKPQTVNEYIATARVYGKFIKDKKLQKIKFYKREPFTRELMPSKIVDSFLRACDDPQCIWCCFWWLVACTGARPNEVAFLELRDISLGGDVIKFRNTKTNSDRMIPIPPQVKPMLTRIIDNLDGEKLFVTNRGKVFSYTSWSKNFKARLKKAGIKDRGYSAYSLRYNYITTMLSQENVNVFQVQRLVGHSRLETTQHYYQLVMEDLRRIIKKHPLARPNVTAEEVIDLVQETIYALKLSDYTGIKQNISRNENEIIIKIKKS